MMNRHLEFSSSKSLSHSGSYFIISLHAAGTCDTSTSIIVYFSYFMFEWKTGQLYCDPKNPMKSDISLFDHKQIMYHN